MLFGVGCCGVVCVGVGCDGAEGCAVVFGAAVILVVCGATCCGAGFAVCGVTVAFGVDVALGASGVTALFPVLVPVLGAT